MKETASQAHKPTSLDWSLAASLALAGGGLLIAAVRRDPNALSFSAPMDGTITAIVVGSLLALVHGLRFRAMAALVAPILLVQIQAIHFAGFSLAPALGLELFIVGILGLVASSRRGEGLGSVAKSTRRRPASVAAWSEASARSSSAR